MWDCRRGGHCWGFLCAGEAISRFGRHCGCRSAPVVGLLSRPSIAFPLRNTVWPVDPNVSLMGFPATLRPPGH